MKRGECSLPLPRSLACLLWQLLQGELALVEKGRHDQDILVASGYGMPEEGGYGRRGDEVGAGVHEATVPREGREAGRVTVGIGRIR